MSAVKKQQSNEDTTVGALIDAAGERLPKYKPYFDKAKPHVIMVCNFLDAMYPYVVKAWEMAVQGWEKLQPYNPQQFFPLIFGLVLCFFGGSYLTLVAAIEAIRLTTWNDMVNSGKTLYKNYLAAKEASAKDDEVDADGDGIADVKQISKQELVHRKVYLIMKSIQPDEASDALALLWGSVLAVIATLRVQFAQAVTLGVSIGQMLHENFAKFAEPTLNEILPPELKKWSPTIVRYAFRSVGVTFAWFLQRIISGFHSAVRGGQLVVSNGIILAKKFGYLDQNFEESGPKVSAMGMAIAMLGFYWQLSNGFGLPFPLNILFLPVTIAEYTIEYWVGL